MPIFLNESSYFNPYTGINKSIQDRVTYSPNWASAFEEALTSTMQKWSHESKMKTLELTSGFKDMNLRDVAASRRERQLDEAAEASEKSLIAVESAKRKGGPIRSLSQLVKRRGQKRQRLQAARKSLEQAQELYKVTGSSFKYEGTGYVPTELDAATLEQEWDSSIEDRKQEYAELYGYDSFDDMPEGYAAITSVYDPNAGVGQRDIMDKIMSDITGVVYRDLVNLNTHDYGTDYGVDTSHFSTRFLQNPEGAKSYVPKNYTQDQLAVLKNFYVTSKLTAYESANKQAAAEDKFRKQAATTSQQQAIKSQKMVQKASTEEVGKSLEDVQLQIRKLDEDFMKNLTSFNTGPRKKKVRSVSFDEGRPE